jgi:hypothetical protein
LSERATRGLPLNLNHGTTVVPKGRWAGVLAEQTLLLMFKTTEVVSQVTARSALSISS